MAVEGIVDNQCLHGCTLLPALDNRARAAPRHPADRERLDNPYPMRLERRPLSGITAVLVGQTPRTQFLRSLPRYEAPGVCANTQRGGSAGQTPERGCASLSVGKARV